MLPPSPGNHNLDLLSSFAMQRTEVYCHVFDRIVVRRKKPGSLNVQMEQGPGSLILSHDINNQSAFIVATHASLKTHLLQQITLRLLSIMNMYFDVFATAGSICTCDVLHISILLRFLKVQHSALKLQVGGWEQL